MEQPLRPSRDVHKLLLSTPARLVGEFESEELLLTLAWPHFTTASFQRFMERGDSIARTAVMLALHLPADEHSPVFPDYSGIGDVVASLLSVLYGKRFDSHGAVEMSGFYQIPDLSALAKPCNTRFRFNDPLPRTDRGVPLDLSEVRRVRGLLGRNGDPKHDGFHTAAKFYRRALIDVEDDPESAYLSLITAGEIISNFREIPDTEAIDDAARTMLDQIAAGLPDGKRIANMLRGRLRGIKRRFVSAIVAQVDEEFFDRTGSGVQHGSLGSTDFEQRIAAAYDLRSRYVHTGYPFGHWISGASEGYEVQLGTPVVPDSEMRKVLARVPRFNGLERIIRYVLLSFAGSLGADIEVEAAALQSD